MQVAPRVGRDSLVYMLGVLNTSQNVLTEDDTERPSFRYDALRASNTLAAPSACHP
jgi:hypothetical protein